MPVVRPKKPVRNGGRRRTPSLPVDAGRSTGLGQGAGTQFMDQFLTKKGSTRSLDFGTGLPQAARPNVATSPSAIRDRARQKRFANQRRSAANNVTGYINPTRGIPAFPTAEELFAQTAAPSPEDLLQLTSEQEYSSTARGEGTYLFPQVSPTKTINPERPRTLESGWERVKDPTDPDYPGILRVRFRDGTAWEYCNVPASVWQRFKRVQSPGRMINRVLNGYRYREGSF